MRNRSTRVEDVARASRELRWLTVRRVLSTLSRFNERYEERVHEADVSTESTAAREDAWVSRSHDHQGRAQGAPAPPCQGAQTAHGVAGRFPRRERLTSSAEFQALFQRGRRIDRPALIVLWREASEPTRGGFAVSRQVKNAVQRNRARRRLREAYRASRDAAPAQARMVIVGRPAALKAPFAVLTGQLRAALGAIPGPRSSE